MFSKILASVGIGSAKVDLVILSEHLVPGHNFDVEIHIEGGNVPQEINGLDLALVTQAKYEKESADGDEYTGYKDIVLQTWKIDWSGTVNPGDKYSEKFELDLHPETPITLLGGRKNQSRVWVETELDIKSGLDSSDKDYLAVSPLPAQLALLEAMAKLGYQFKKVDVEFGQLRHPHVRSELHCYQEIEFKLSGSGIFGIKEVEVSFINTGDEIGVVFEIDRSFGSDTYKSTMLSADLSDPDDIVAEIERILR